MADNIVLNSGTGGEVVASDEINDIQHQRVKVQIGNAGEASDVSINNPMPVVAGGDGSLNVEVDGDVLIDSSTPVSTATTISNSDRTATSKLDKNDASLQVSSPQLSCMIEALIEQQKITNMYLSDITGTLYNIEDIS